MRSPLEPDRSDAAVISGVAPACTGIGRDAISARGRLSAGAGAINGIAQPLDHRFEHWNYGFQMLQIMTVAIAGAVVESFRHLSVARGARVSAVLLEGKAAFIERLPDEVEQTANRRLLRIHNVLIAEWQIAQRHLRPVMLHQVHGQQIMPRRAFQRVGAIKTMRQMIGEGGQHHIERMAHDVDQRRLRKHQRDQSEMRFVERHLIGEPPCLPLDDSHAADVIEVVVAQFVEPVPTVGHPEFGQRLGIAERAVQHPRHRLGDLVDERQLVAGADPRMRRQGLLDQCRTRPGETEHKDRL